MKQIFLFDQQHADINIKIIKSVNIKIKELLNTRLNDLVGDRIIDIEIPIINFVDEKTNETN